MMQELIQWLNAQNIDYTTIDNEVVEIPNFGKMFLADLSGVECIFKSKDGDIRFNLMENPQELQDEGIFYVAFPFGNNWYYYDLREEFRFNILKHIGKPKPSGKQPWASATATQWLPRSTCKKSVRRRGLNLCLATPSQCCITKQRSR